MKIELINERFEYYQTLYLKDRSDQHSLGQMMLIVGQIAKHYVYRYAKQKRVFFSRERVQDICSDVIARVLTRYKTNSTWSAKKATSFFYFDTFKVITQTENISTMQQRFEDSMMEYINEKIYL